MSDVVVSSAPANVRPEFRDVFVSRTLAKLKTCAHGDRPLRLEATIIDFHRSNGAKAYLIGDANRIRGAAKLVDPASGEVVGDYDIDRSVGGGGLLPAIAMSHAQEQMSDAFADEVCKQAFIAR